MAISPIPLTGAPVTHTSNLQNLNQPHADNNNSSVTSITDTLQAVKESSLLYQLVSRLLLSPAQDKQLSESLEQTAVDPSVETTINQEQAVQADSQVSSNSGNFSLSIEISMLQVQEQTLIINDETGQFTQQQVVVEAVSIRLEVSMAEQQAEEADPLIIDVNGDGFSTTGIEQGSIFDINADGILDQVSVTKGDDAFLALDLNNNGYIDDGSELFGDQGNFSNGFANLASYDDNQDGIIDANDQIFNSLLMMRLVDNKQFISELSNTDIQSINLGYNQSSARTEAGDRIVQMSDYQNSKGQTGVIADLMLQYKSGISE